MGGRTAFARQTVPIIRKARSIKKHLRGCAIEGSIRIDKHVQRGEFCVYQADGPVLLSIQHFRGRGHGSRVERGHRGSRLMAAFPGKAPSQCLLWGFLGWRQASQANHGGRV